MILAADFGGTVIKLGVVGNGHVLASARLEAQAHEPMRDRLEVVATTFEALLKSIDCSPAECAGVGLSLPFITDPKNKRVMGEFGKFPGAAEIAFEEWSRERLGLPMALENDLRVAVLGEWSAGAAKGRQEVVMLALGTGIGCAVLSKGLLYGGARNRAATLLGHSSIRFDGAPSRCGNVGCAEDLASTATLPILARAHPGFASSALSGHATIDYKLLFDCAGQGDACAKALVDQSLRVWGTVILNAVIAYDPELVVLGGGVLRSKELIIPAIEEHLREHAPALPLEVPIVAAALGDDATLVGCEVLFKQTQSTL